MAIYEHSAVETKWQKYWEENTRIRRRRNEPFEHLRSLKRTAP